MRTEDELLWIVPAWGSSIQGDEAVQTLVGKQIVKTDHSPLDYDAQVRLWFSDGSEMWINGDGEATLFPRGAYPSLGHG